MTKRITAHLTIAYVPLPADKVFAYFEAHRILHELAVKAMLARKHDEADLGSLPPAQAGSPVRVLPPPQLEALPRAGVTNPPDPSQAPAGASSPSLQAELLTGIAG